MVNLISPPPFSPGAPIVKVKTTDETVTADTTVSSDSDLQFQVEANQKYIIHIVAFVTTNTTPDFKFGTTQPTGSNSYVTYSWSNAAGTIDGGHTINPTAEVVLVSDANYVALTIDVFLDQGSTAGTWALQWAQNTSDAFATGLKRGSRMERWRT